MMDAPQSFPQSKQQKPPHPHAFTALLHMRQSAPNAADRGPSSSSSSCSSLPPSPPSPPSSSTALGISPPSSSSSFLPHVLWHSTLSFLTPREIVQGPCRISKEWHDEIATSQDVWKPILEMCLPSLLPTSRSSPHKRKDSLGSDSDASTTATTSSITKMSATHAIPSSEPAAPSAAAPPSPQPKLPSSSSLQYFHIYRRRQEAAQLLLPLPPRTFTDFDLAVDVRNKLTGEVWYSCRGPLDDSFPEALFLFSGWVLQPEVVFKEKSLLFPDLATALAFLGEQGNACEMDFTLIDKTNGKMADFSSIALRRGDMGTSAAAASKGWTRCAVGWGNESDEEELWMFKGPDACFLGGALKIVRGLTLRMEKMEEDVNVEADEAGCASGRKELLRVTPSSVWVCDHQYMGATLLGEDQSVRPTAKEVGKIFNSLRWV